MPGTPPGWSWSDVDIAVARPSARLPGVGMAGFRQRVPVSRLDIAMVAHPSVTLLLDLSGRLVSEGPDGCRRGSVVVGLLPDQVRATGVGAAECLQIRLDPATATTVFGASTDLAGTVVTLADLWGRAAGQVEDRLRAAASWDDRFAVVAEVLGDRLDARRPADPEVLHAWRRNFAGAGQVRVEHLADEVGWSRQRLWSRFRDQLGITPKRAARLVRFDRAAHLLAAGRPAARVAVECGYADQSHLHRDVRDVTGLTPAALAVAPWLAIDDTAWPRPVPA